MNGCLSITVVVSLFSLRLAAAVSIDTVHVGYAGNAPDQAYHHVNSGDLQFGAVNYGYRISTYEVTNAQYTEFLNAKAKTNGLHLFDDMMESNPLGGINQSGTSGNFTYAVKPNMGNKPVNFVSWYDAVRFVNWLHNGQGNGNTETGAYTLLGGSFIPSNGNAVTRNPGAAWFLPNENEWYKAAYYDPRSEAEGGPPGSDHYWLYPTKSDTAPTLATANSSGDISNPGVNVANYNLGADWNGQNGNVTTVGTAGLLSASFFGTFDQGGNVWEWTEDDFGPFFRITRQGSWGHDATQIAASYREFADSGFHDGAALGFRVATIPEPGALLLALVGGIAVYIVARRRGPT